MRGKEHGDEGKPVLWALWTAALSMVTVSKDMKERLVDMNEKILTEGIQGCIDM